MAHTESFGGSSLVNSGAWRVLAWIGVALQLVALIAVLWVQRWGGAWTIGLFLVLSAGFLWIEERLPSLISFLVVLAAMINAAGWAWNWFNQIVWYDEMVHLFTSFAVMSAIGYLGWLWGFLGGEPGSGSFILKVALIGLGLGIAWEIVEALFLNLTWTDTIVDLIMDTIGAALGGGFVGWVIKQEGAKA